VFCAATNGRSACARSEGAFWRGSQKRCPRGSADLGGLIASSADEREHSCTNQREADRGEADDAESQEVDPCKCESWPSSPSASIRAIRQQDHGYDEPGEKPQGRRILLGSHDQQVPECYCGGDDSRNDRPEVPRSRQRLTHTDRLPAASNPCPAEHRSRTSGREIGRSGYSTDDRSSASRSNSHGQ
jgi:hypothetical protein